MAPVIGFRVRILNPDGSQITPGVDNADDAWEVWRGGGEQTIKDCKPGKDTFKPDTRAGDLVLQGPVTSGRKDMLQWYQDTLSGSKTYRRMLTITEIDDPADGTPPVEGKTYVYHDAFPVRYRVSELRANATTGNVMEEVAIKPIRVELK
jgi:hypothetical protein